MDASLLEPVSLAEQVRSLLAEVVELRAEVGSLRRENAELRQQVTDLTREVGYWKSRHADTVQRNVKLQAQLDQANAEIRQLKAERFGKRSEKQTSADRSNELLDPDALAAPKNKRGQQPGRAAPRRRDYSHLPTREETVDVPEVAKVCACCGLALASVGYSDDHDQIEIETVIYRGVVRRKRYRSTCTCVAQPRTVTAELPAKLLPKSIYGTSLWVHLLVEKFHLQRPTQRTIDQLRLLGVNLALGTITDGLKRIEPLLEPIYAALRTRHRQSTYFHADETRWKVFAEKSGKVGHCWWLWLSAESRNNRAEPSRPKPDWRRHMGGIWRNAGIWREVSDPRLSTDDRLCERDAAQRGQPDRQAERRVETDLRRIDGGRVLEHPPAAVVVYYDEWQ